VAEVSAVLDDVELLVQRLRAVVGRHVGVFHPHHGEEISCQVQVVTSCNWYGNEEEKRKEKQRASDDGFI
jgi:hypothetical protein